MSDLETNVAETLREIAANSDKITGKILKKIQAAAKDGKYHIEVEVTEDEYNWLSAKTWGSNLPSVTPPLIEKLLSLGFELKKPDQRKSFWDNYHYYISIYW